MTRTTRRLCNHPGCMTLTPSPNTTRCAAHALEPSNEPTDAAQQRRRIYNTRRWRRLSKATRHAHPTCPCGQPSEVVDHVLGLDNILAEGGDPYDPDELQAICLECSGSKDGARTPSPRQTTLP